MDKKLIKNPPLGIRIISILHYLSSFAYFIFGVSSLIFPNRIATNIVIQNKLDYSLIGSISTAIIILSIVLMLGMAVLEFFIARGLWRGKRWTRVMVVIFGIINIAFIMLLLFLLNGKILDFIGGFILAGINLAIILYLISKSKEFFKKEKKK